MNSMNNMMRRDRSRPANVVRPGGASGVTPDDDDSLSGSAAGSAASPASGSTGSHHTVRTVSEYADASSSNHGEQLEDFPDLNFIFLQQCGEEEAECPIMHEEFKVNDVVYVLKRDVPDVEANKPVVCILAEGINGWANTEEAVLSGGFTDPLNRVEGRLRIAHDYEAYIIIQNPEACSMLQHIKPVEDSELLYFEKDGDQDERVAFSKSVNGWKGLGIPVSMVLFLFIFYISHFPHYTLTKDVYIEFSN